MTIEGVDPEEFGAAETAAFELTVSATLDASAHVAHVTRVYEGVATERRRLETGSSTVEYTILTTLKVEEVRSLMETAVYSGAFVAALAAVAPVFENATATDLEVFAPPTAMPTRRPTATPTARPTPALTSVPSAGEGAGLTASSGGGGSSTSAPSTPLLVGVCAGAALLVLGAFLLARRHRRERSRKTTRPRASSSLLPDDIDVELPEISVRAVGPVVNTAEGLPRLSTGASESTFQASYYVKREHRRLVWSREGGRCSWMDDGEHEPKFVIKSPAVRGGYLELVRASEGIALHNADPLVRAALDWSLSWAFDQRVAAFHEALGRQRVSWEVGRVELEVRRSEALSDAFAKLGALPAERWAQPWFIRFKGEAGLDAGGLSREY